MYIYLYICIYTYIFIHTCIGGKGAAMQFRFVFNPRQVEKFLVKDSHSKITAEILASDVNIRVVGAGKNDDDVYLMKITTWQWVTKSISILIRNQPGGHKCKIKSIRKKYS
jgi:hypothetical protein